MARQLTPKEWAHVKRLFIAGWTQPQLAKGFGIPEGSISVRCAKENWVRWRPEALLQQLENEGNVT